MKTAAIPEIAADDSGAKDRPRRLNPSSRGKWKTAAPSSKKRPADRSSHRHTEEQLGVYVSASETARLSALAEDLRTQLTALTAEWEDLMMQLEEQGALS